MMHALTLLHRWLGVALCSLFAMWFASGIVMHFVPFPALTETARVDGLAVLDVAGLAHGPADAIAASGIKDATRVRLLQRSDGPIYVVSGRSGIVALHAADLANAAVSSQPLALAIATDDAHRRHLDFTRARIAGLAAYDQWTVPGGFDAHRPLYRIALGDSRSTALYVSSRTGEVVLQTTRRERAWNYVGSVAHWVYATPLRSHPAVWSLVLRWLSLLALVGATAGAVLGTLRIGVEQGRLVSPYSGVQVWHHWLGLICGLFVLTWIFSGWLSLDDGRFFSNGKPSAADSQAIIGAPAWNALPRDEIRHVSVPAKEVEWFAFGGRIYRRERISAGQQRLVIAGGLPNAGTSERTFLEPVEIDAAMNPLAFACDKSFVVGPNDAYAVVSTTPGAPVYRVVCGDVWFHIDGAGGVVLEKLDSSRRAYRWLYGALHTLDFPFLTARPALRAILIVILCGFGVAFSLTGVVIAWRRLMSCFR
jgi:hypothetical protein